MFHLFNLFVSSIIFLVHKLGNKLYLTHSEEDKIVTEDPVYLNESKQKRIKVALLSTSTKPRPDCG